MTTPYDAGRRNAASTDSAPSYQTLKNAGLNDTQAGEFLKGYEAAKK